MTQKCPQCPHKSPKMPHLNLLLLLYIYIICIYIGICKRIYIYVCVSYRGIGLYKKSTFFEKWVKNAPYFSVCVSVTE
jgi:hypothetical protein